MSDDSETKVTLARHDERIKTVEGSVNTMGNRLWAVIVTVLLVVIGAVLKGVQL